MYYQSNSDPNSHIVSYETAHSKSDSRRPRVVGELDVSGCVAARNSVRFKYPLRECLTSLVPFCKEIVLAYDPYTNDGTHELALQLRAELDIEIILVESKWNMENIYRGLEIGHQSQVAVNHCGKTGWRLCVQQDEAFDEEDASRMREYIEKAGDEITGFDFVRPYFFGNLYTIRKDWSPILTRLTKTGAPYTYDGFDGQNCLPLPNHKVRNPLTNIWLFHYSRIGDPKEISIRIRNVDSFFHKEEDLIPESELPEYDFKLREFDSYVKKGGPSPLQVVPPDLFRHYNGKHPKAFENLYKDWGFGSKDGQL